MKEIKEIGKKTIKLNKEINQEIIVCDSKDNPAFSKKNKIYLDKGIFEILSENEIKSVIYHERYHLTKEGKLFLQISNLFIIIGAILIIIFLMTLTSLLPLIKVISINPYLLMLAIFFLMIGYLFRWFLETICDANAIINTDKKEFTNALKLIYKNLDKIRKGFKNFEARYLLHVPPRLRLKIINSWDK